MPPKPREPEIAAPTWAAGCISRECDVALKRAMLLLTEADIAKVLDSIDPEIKIGIVAIDRELAIFSALMQRVAEHLAREARWACDPPDFMDWTRESISDYLTARPKLMRRLGVNREALADMDDEAFAKFVHRVAEQIVDDDDVAAEFTLWADTP